MQLSRLRSNNGKDATTRASILPEGTPLEFQVLLYACRVFLGTEGPERLEALLGRGPDWGRLLALANRHGVMPLLYRSISHGCPQAVPQEWMARLRMQYMKNTARNVMKTDELLKLLDLFKEKGIEAIPIKGPALSQTAYGDIALRMFSDLDILMSVDNVLQAKKVLVSNGYKPIFNFDFAQEKAFLRTDCEYNFINAVSGDLLEIHWRIAPPSHSLDIEVKDIMSHTKNLTLERRNILMISFEDQLIALCIHGAKHRWVENTLKMICDIAVLVNNCKCIDWNSIISQCRKIRIVRILLLGLVLARNFMNIDLPKVIIDEIDRDKVVRSLSISIVDHYPKDSKKLPKLTEELSFWFSVRENPLDKLSCIMRIASAPNSADLSLVMLPGKLYPLYYLIHPIRLICRYG